MHCKTYKSSIASILSPSLTVPGAINQLFACFYLREIAVKIGGRSSARARTFQSAWKSGWPDRVSVNPDTGPILERLENSPSMGVPVEIVAWFYHLVSCVSARERNRDFAVNRHSARISQIAISASGIIICLRNSYNNRNNFYNSAHKRSTL